MTGTYASKFNNNKKQNKQKKNKKFLDSISQSLSKCDSWANIISILCVLIRNTKFGATPVSASNSGVEPGKLCFTKSPTGDPDAKFSGPLTKTLIVKLDSRRSLFSFRTLDFQAPINLLNHVFREI